MVPSPAVTDHVPPPVTALDAPPLAGTTKVPEPVKVMVEQPTFPKRPAFVKAQSIAVATAVPPGLKVHGYVPLGPVQVTVAMSQRTCSL
jgi:hypothetical protein